MNREDSQAVVSALTANFRQGEDHVEFIQNSQTDPQILISSPGQQDFQKIHLQYMTEKLARKKQFQKRKREEFGASSSEQDDIGGSESDSDSDRRQSTVQEQSRFRQSLKIREARSQQKQKQQKCQIYFSIKKLKDNWSLQTLNFQEHSILISSKPYFLKQFHKIKLIHGICIADCHRIKLSKIDSNQIFMAASCKNYQGFPLNYYILASIVEQKLINMGWKLFKCNPANVPGIPETLIKNSYNFGKIFKKSQILGKWQQRLIVINKQGIFSYKKFNDKHSMFISGNSVKQIWTRFEIEENMLVIKILHSSSTKTEFGIPLTETLDKKCWLYSFYLLAFPH